MSVRNGEKRVVTRNSYCAVFLLTTCILTACSKTPPEEAILANIANIQEAVENKKTGSVIVHIKDDFLGNGYLSKTELRRLLIAQFLQHKNINVVITSIEVEHRPELPLRATMMGSALLTGTENLLPDDGRLLRLNGTWRLTQDTWLLESLSWE